MRHTLRTLLILATLASPNAAQLINGGFERGEYLVAFPFSFGVWGVDLLSFVEAENGIVPAEGNQMARFDATTLGTPAVGDVADTWNLADVSPWSNLVASGHAHVRVEAFFNRVSGSPCVDTRFALQVQAQDGLPETYPFDWPDPIVDSEIVSLFSDGDVATWEGITVGLDLPVQTTFAAVILFAIEDVCDTGVPPFEGHYADDVRLFVDAWIDIGSATAGAAGEPHLVATGELSGGAQGELRLENAAPSSPAVLFTTLGDTSPIAIAGGTLAAFPVTLAAARPTTNAGTAIWAYDVPASVAPNVLVTSQFAILDPNSANGVTFSNAVEGMTH